MSLSSILRTTWTVITSRFLICFTIFFKPFGLTSTTQTCAHTHHRLCSDSKTIFLKNMLNNTKNMPRYIKVCFPSRLKSTLTYIWTNGGCGCRLLSGRINWLGNKSVSRCPRFPPHGAVGRVGPALRSMNRRIPSHGTAGVWARQVGAVR